MTADPLGIPCCEQKQLIFKRSDFEMTLKKCSDQKASSTFGGCYEEEIWKQLLYSTLYIETEQQTFETLWCTKS